jgi:hypothetical protein
MFLELKTATGLYRINADEAAWISTEPSGVVVLHGGGTEDEVHLGDYLPLTLPKGADLNWRMVTEDHAGTVLRHWINLRHVLAFLPTPTGTRIRVCGREFEVIESVEDILRGEDTTAKWDLG